jgi:hypothetical protein
MPENHNLKGDQPPDKPPPAAKIHEDVTHPKNIEIEAVFDF